MASITYDIQLTYEKLREIGVCPAKVYVPAYLAEKAKEAVRELHLPVKIISVRALEGFGKMPKCTYKTIKRDYAKRNR